MAIQISFPRKDEMPLSRERGGGGLRAPGARTFEPRHNKTNKMCVLQAKTQISLGIRPVWSDTSLSAWRNLGSLATHWAHCEDSDQTGRMPRLIWVFAGRTLILLVWSCRGSFFSHRLQSRATDFQLYTVTHHRELNWAITDMSLVMGKSVFGISDQVRSNRPPQL